MADSGDEKGRALKTPQVPGERTTPYGTPDPSGLTTELHLTDSALSALASRFDLLGEVGHGGMGIVYRARDRETGETVALKVLKPEIASNPGVLERFKSELRLARKITHKNVCRTYELHRFGQITAIAMEYVEGESLRSVLDKLGGVPLRRGLEWVSQVCAGLNEAHSQGVVHRDLKPENILIDGRGQLKVMDFGIAKSLETDATSTGSVLGTPAYMSPEQAEGKTPDARSDIYSLGLILYEMFTGRKAFQAETPVAFLLKQIRDTPPPPRQVEPGLPAYIEEAIVKCLEKDPARRFPSAAALEAFFNRESGEKKGASPSGPAVSVATPPWLQQGNMKIALAALVALAVIVSNSVFSEGHFAVSLLVIADVVLLLVTWPTLRTLRALFWIGAGVFAVNWSLACFIGWTLGPWLAMRLAVNPASERQFNFTLGVLAAAEWIKYLAPLYALLFLLSFLFEPQPEPKNRLLQKMFWWNPSRGLRAVNRFSFGVVFLAANLILTGLLVYGGMVLPLLLLGKR